MKIKIFFPRATGILLILLISLIIGGFFIFFQRFNPVRKESNFIEEELFSNIIIRTEPSKSTPQLIQPVQPPEITQAVYLTSWSAASSRVVDYILKLAEDTEINTVVVDIKDWSGYVAYDTEIPEVEQYNGERILIFDLKALLEKFKKEEIYPIARIVVFQDPILARARPELAIYRKSKENSLWLDKSGLAWIDPKAKEAWDYNIAIAKEALKLGFGEVNFDYVRFPSDGNLKDMSFPFWDGTTPRSLIIKDFYQYLREKIPEAPLSIDLFGLSTLNSDLGIGQIIEDAYLYFDFVCPMVYPSHYDSGFLGYKNPAEHPYEVVKYSMENALKKLNLFHELQPTKVKLRPWLQDFDLGADYGKKEVLAEMKAVLEVLGENFSGFMLWNPKNIYTKEALLPR